MADTKNVHLEHLEDSILNKGFDGISEAFSFLDDLAGAIHNKSKSNFTMTVKWDGKPAIFCGQYPGTTDFFLAIKGLFNVNPKVMFTEQDVDLQYPGSPGLARKLKYIMKYLRKLDIKGVLQGDLLFTDQSGEGQGITKTTSEGKFFEFKPNTILYSIPEGHRYYEKARAAKVGVAFHTQYNGDSIDTLSLTYGFDPSKIRAPREVCIISAEFTTLGKNLTLTDAEKLKLQQIKSRAKTHMQGTKDQLAVIAKTLKGKPRETPQGLKYTVDYLSIGPKLKQYFNTRVRLGQSISGGAPFLTDFMKWYEGECIKAAKQVNKSATKAAKMGKYFASKTIINDNKATYIKIINLYKDIQDAKEIFISKLKKGKDLGYYFVSKDGLTVKPTDPEGFVAIQDGNRAYKLVERLGFSQENFQGD